MFGWQNRSKQLLNEIETHLEIETQKNIDAGMPPDHARQAAKQKFGNVLVAVEQSRGVWGALWLENLLRDIRYAARSLSAVPGYTAMLVCTLTLGLGCVTAMLAIIESVLLLPMNLPHPNRLVQIYSEAETEGFSASAHALSYAAIDAVRRNTRSLVGVSGYNIMARPVVTSEGARINVLMEVTPDFFQTLGVSAKFGRLIGAGDSNAPVAVASDEFWRDRLKGDSKAIGAGITISGKQWTVIGVLPRGFHAPGTSGGPIIYLPISIGSSGEDGFGIESAAVIGRLKDGVSMQQVRAEAQSVFAHAGHTYAEQHRELMMRSYRDLVTGDVQRPLWALLGAALVLLLIACANAANLQIGRTASRMPEMTVRSALGAGFGRLMQQLVTENVLVSLVGAALGGGLSFIAVAAVRHAYAGKYPRFDELSVHPPVLGAVCVLAAAVGVVASVAPALSVRRKTTGRFAQRSATRRARLPGLLVAIQVALTCVLLVTSGLFVRTLRSLEDVKLGFDPRGVTTLVLMPENQQQDPQLSREMETRLLHRFENLPGIQSVTTQTEIPFSSYNMVLHGTTDVAGRPYHKGDSAYYSFVSTSFVKTSGIQLLRGRGFLSMDESSGALVALVNEAFVKMFLSDQEPIGATIRFHRNPGETVADLPFTRPMSVVGVVENEVQGGDLGAPYEPMVYLDDLALPKGSFLSQVFSMSVQYAVRSALPTATVASELRAVVKQDAPTMVEMSLKPMEEEISESLGQRKLALRLVAGFGIVALILSAVGIYGVLAYSVALRRREIGIRMALGSTRQNAAWLVVRQAGKMILLGLVPGIAGAWAAGHAVRSFLYGVKAFDAETLVAAGAVLLLVAAAAAFIPAIRAAQIDPVDTLRTE
ncbi:putative permease [Candidatus Sulfotelmatomonas gaucii]|uniref:Putative permease n=1 Tax=Candidatus Sulfuritelmatomonas gaucii TaxID=2043161 RepID=A0A2N9LVM4_9BACT|nr:putative permease [Candidatus Sulfotelmatomonas gaucii]